MRSLDSPAILFLLCAIFAGSQGDEVLQLGERRNLSVQRSSGTLSFVLYLNKTEGGQSPAVRLSLSSENISDAHPVLVTAQQTRGVSSWSIPYVENGFAYSFIERTLCPLLNIDTDHPNSTDTVILKISTSSPTPVPVQLMASIFEQFYHYRVDGTTTSVTASPSAPVYILFEHPEDHPKVRVRFSSMDSTRNVCAIASVQKTYCPVTELLDNPDHRGIYQSMLSQAAIDVEFLPLPAAASTTITDQQQSVFRFFYMVVSVFPSNDSCSSPQVAERGQLLSLERVDNFNPVLADGPVLLKNINITIDPAFPDWGYGVAVLVPVLVFSLIYLVALSWIFLVDCIYFYSNPMVKLVEDRAARLMEFEEAEQLLRETEEDPSVGREDRLQQGITREMSEDVRRLSDGEEESIEVVVPRDPECYKENDETDGVQEAQMSVCSSPARLMGVALDGGSNDPEPPSVLQTLSFLIVGHYSLKEDSVHRVFDGSRPKFHEVLLGTQYNKATEKLTPLSPHYPDYLQEPSSKKPGRHRAAATGGLDQPDGVTLNDLNTNRTPSTSIRPSCEASISLTVPIVNQVALHNRRRLGLVLSAGQDEVDFSAQGSVHRQESYVNAINMESLGERRVDDVSRPQEGKCIGFCGNGKCMCELGEFDETSKIQKKYNLLSWYLMAAIIFYAIPAYQLVTTYQQLLTVSGNHDLCYFNSLCSISWRSPLITFNAFNNLYSNIGYIMLGFLFIIITYRRQKMYVVVEKIVNNPFITTTSNRVGVPQHFGIYYAIGIAMIAEGLMSTAYHICPGRTNYQFDTTFMYVMACLGIFKLLESRTPDLKPGLHELFVMVACMILFIVIGVLYASSIVFYIIFFFIHIVATFLVTLEIYYHWQIKFFKWETYCKVWFALKNKPCQKLWLFLKSKPKKMPKFIFILMANLINWCFALSAVLIQPSDFGTFFLLILLVNFILLFIYYTIMKCVYHDWPSLRPIVFLVLALVFWGLGVYFYTRAATNWLNSPAVSRDGNTECFAVFFDTHDMWHFSSALALFFSFLMLTTIDDNAAATPRTKLRVF